MIEAYVLTLSSLNFEVDLRIFSIATEVVPDLLCFNWTYGPAILFVALLHKLNSNFFNATVGFYRAKPAPGCRPETGASPAKAAATTAESGESVPTGRR
jgi:hypothetical protein